MEVMCAKFANELVGIFAAQICGKVWLHRSGFINHGNGPSPQHGAFARKSPTKMVHIFHASRHGHCVFSIRILLQQSAVTEVTWLSFTHFSLRPAYVVTDPDWCFGTFLFFSQKILGISSSQLTYFSEGFCQPPTISIDLP